MIAVILHTTFTRFEWAKKTIESFAKYPRFKLYIADTGEITAEKQDYYRKLEEAGHFVAFCGWDTSPAITRNFLVDQATEDFIFKIDDDFEFKPDLFDVDHVLKLFRDNPAFGLFGFSVKSDVWASQFVYDLEKTDRGLYMLKHKIKKSFIPCDVTPDCWIARREMFPDCNWDERYHVCEGLHTDFFAQIKFFTKWKVAYLSNQTIWTFKHEEGIKIPDHIRRNSFYNRKRFRHMEYVENGPNKVDYSKFCDKWGVKEFIKR